MPCDAGPATRSAAKTSAVRRPAAVRGGGGVLAGSVQAASATPTATVTTEAPLRRGERTTPSYHRWSQVGLPPVLPYRRQGTRRSAPGHYILCGSEVSDPATVALLCGEARGHGRKRRRHARQARRVDLARPAGADGRGGAVPRGGG